MTPCGFVRGYQHFRNTYCLGFQYTNVFPEDGRSRLLRNIRNHLRNYMLYPRRLFSPALEPLGPWLVIFEFHDYFTDGRTLWTGDQLVTRPLPKHRTTQTQNKHTQIPNIHALCGIEPTIEASERAKTIHALDPSATETGPRRL
jgi:hypothetical protein